MCVAGAPALAFLVRWFGVGIATNSASVMALIAAGLLGIIGGTLASVFRTVHEEVQDAMDWLDIWGANLAIAAYAVAIVLCLP